MASKINRTPEGLLGLLQSKANGQNPNLLMDEVRGGFDMFPLWAAFANFQESFSQTINAINTGPVVTVPNTEVWWLYSVRASFLSNDVNQSVRLAISLNDFPFVSGGAGSYTVVSDQDLRTPANGTRQDLIHDFSQPLVVRPGTEIQSFARELNLNTAPSASLTTQALFARLPV